MYYWNARHLSKLGSPDDADDLCSGIPGYGAADNTSSNADADATNASADTRAVRRSSVCRLAVQRQLVPKREQHVYASDKRGECRRYVQR